MNIIAHRICNTNSREGEENAMPQFWHGSGPVTSCMHACSESGRYGTPLSSFVGHQRHSHATSKESYVIGEINMVV